MNQELLRKFLAVLHGRPPYDCAVQAAEECSVLCGPFSLETCRPPTDMCLHDRNVWRLEDLVCPDPECRQPVPVNRLSSLLTADVLNIIKSFDGVSVDTDKYTTLEWICLHCNKRLASFIEKCFENACEHLLQIDVRKQQDRTNVHGMASKALENGNVKIHAPVECAQELGAVIGFRRELYGKLENPILILAAGQRITTKSFNKELEAGRLCIRTKEPVEYIFFRGYHANEIILEKHLSRAGDTLIEPRTGMCLRDGRFELGLTQYDRLRHFRGESLPPHPSLLPMKHGLRGLAIARREGFFKDIHAPFAGGEANEDIDLTPH
ncbi:uncharacterized protein BDR25DRAFT_350201 [Lindgomyces ingoldianus]|uniref:Uncharacterized protein n=1 Tax=Lindgomyces ingoldianus TaxID=673940 RepID=A0ACB6R9Q2_9PLEO|nr:uncharacterized protein BDR25DRAFT_350201 [Lindgomyces ingoldianus]KAF2475921.1 hypothetical protein BDR25DRAFT_350201 [Lindgomyces ingoldianus]